MSSLAAGGRFVALALAILVLGAGTGCGTDDAADNEQAPAAQGDELPEFGYEGEVGPQHWGDLDPAYRPCSEGRRQSPVELADAEPAELPEIRFAYEPAELEVKNNGHSVEATYPPGSTIEVEGVEYELKQFHYHAPSEHRVDGRAAESELHFVHESEAGELVVIGALVEEGEENSAFAELSEALPAREGETARVPGQVNARDLLPADPGVAQRWSYDGSLTTPPCSEGVGWHVLKPPVELSGKQIARFTDVYEGNNRPLQPLGERTLLESR